MTAANLQLARNTVSALRQAPRPQPLLRLVHDIDAPAVVHLEPRPAIIARTWTAINKAFAFALVVVAFVGLAIGSYSAGWNDKIMMEARETVAELMAAPLKAPMTPAGFDRITGQRTR